MAKIVRIADPLDPLLAQVYDVFSADFSLEQLGEFDVLQEEIALGMDADAPCLLLAATRGDEVLGGISGNYFHSPHVGGIAYIAVPEATRRKGIGAALVREFEYALSRYSNAFGGSLETIMLEANRPSETHSNYFDSRPFWDAMGYRIPRGAVYRQPCMDFEDTGLPEHDAVPSDFMVKQMDGSMEVSALHLKRSISTLFDLWYLPQRENFSSDEAHQLACEHVYVQFVRLSATLHVVDRKVDLMRYSDV